MIAGAGIEREIFQIIVYYFHKNNRHQVKLNKTNEVTLAVQWEYTPSISSLLHVWEEA
jgi:hypothetical protein